MAYTPYQIKDNAASTFYVQTSTFGGNGGTTTTGIVNVFDLVAVGGTAIAMGQQTAAASFPVVLPAAQITALTPPSTISVSSLPSLPTGTNGIGSVTVTALPSLPTGTNTIGTVNLSASTITALTPPTTVGVNTNADGSLAGGAAATKSFAVGGIYNTSLPTLTNGQQSAIQVDSSGRMITVLAGGTSSIGTVTLDTTNSGYLSTISTAQGAGGTGISQPTGGSGLLGWLSGIYKAITSTLTVSGSVTANAGTNLNTSLLAVETGGNLTTLAGAVSGGKVQANITNSSVPVTGTFWQTTQPMTMVPSATNGLTPYRSLPTGATNQDSTVIKSSAGTLFGIQASSIATSAVWLKLYDTATAPTSSSTPIKTILIPANTTSANGAGNNLNLSTMGVKFSNGIAFRVSTGIADSDATAVTTGQLAINFDYV